MTTTDLFTEAARAEAERRWPRLPQDPSGHYLNMGKRVGFDLGAQWARDHLAAHDARVKRDAAREALRALRTHLAASRGHQLIGPDGLDYYINTHHPEETP